MNGTQLQRNYKTVDFDELPTNTGQSICANGHSDGHNDSGKEEIQDSVVSSLPMLGNVQTTGNSSQTVSTVQKIERLYQHPGRSDNTLHRVKHRRSWTDSKATFQNAAKREYELLLANHRQANHLVTVKYLREFSAQAIRTGWATLKALLLQRGIIAFAVVEITTGIHVLSDGNHWHFPINRIHYHFLVDSDLSERQLRDIFNRSCIDAGLVKNEFEVQYEAISDRAAFEHKCKYILKFDTFKDKAILFRPEKEIGKLNKICSIGRWFMNADCTKANKDEMWKSIVAGWYPK